jgi:hypothetical protein
MVSPDREWLHRVEWGSGAAAVGRACLFPPLSSGGALVARPWLRFHSPLIEPDLGAHLGTLEKAGYMKVEKDFNGRKPRTRVRLSDAGRRAYADYVAYLRAILDGDGAAAASRRFRHAD